MGDERGDGGVGAFDHDRPDVVGGLLGVCGEEEPVRGRHVSSCDDVEVGEHFQRLSRGRVGAGRRLVLSLHFTSPAAHNSSTVRGLLPRNPADEPASVLLERIRAKRAAQPQPAPGRRTCLTLHRHAIY